MFSLIIPVYNEEISVKNVLSDYTRELSQLPYLFEMIIVDDCSTDKSREIVKSFPVRLIANNKNMGYGKSLKIGIEAATYDNIIITDCDNSYPAFLIKSLIEKYLAGENMTVAARSGSNFTRNIFEKASRGFLRLLVEILVNKTIVDVNSGYRIFNRHRFIPFLDKMSDQFSFTTSLTMICAYSKIPIVYVPFTYGKRDGKSKVNYLIDTIKTLKRMFALFYFFRIKRN